MKSSRTLSVWAATKQGRLALGFVGILVVLLFAQLAPSLGWMDPRSAPPVTEVFIATAALFGSSLFWLALGQTLATWAIGLVSAMILGTVLGMAIGSNKTLRAYTTSTIEFLRPIPSVAIIPVAVLLFGTGMPATLIIAIYAAFWQVLIQVSYGAQDVDPVAMDTARVFHFRPHVRVMKVLWPTALPYVMTGFRLAAVVALILTITGELIIGTPGLGKTLALAQQAHQVSTVFALAFVVGFLGLAVNAIAQFVERSALHWHASVRREVV